MCVGPRLYCTGAVAQLAKEFPRSQFIYMDVEASSEVASDRYKVIALPTFKVFKWGKEAASLR